MNLVASHSLIGGGDFTGSNEITFLEFLAVGFEGIDQPSHGIQRVTRNIFA